jgi:hypothetical protein
MNRYTKMIVSAATAIAVSLSLANANQAAEVMTMKPLHALSFDVGAKRAVGYFLPDNETCKLVLTMADAPNLGEAPSLTTTRFEAAIDGGTAKSFDVAEGKALEFSCHPGAQKMSVRWLAQIASSPPGR